MPSANQLVYDHYNALAIGFCPTDRAYDSIFSVAVFARGVNLFFFNGPNLPDPQRLLKGGGNMVRHIRLAIEEADPPLASSGRGRVIIKSISKKRRSRKSPVTSRKSNVGRGTKQNVAPRT